MGCPSPAPPCLRGEDQYRSAQILWGGVNTGGAEITGFSPVPPFTRQAGIHSSHSASEGFTWRLCRIMEGYSEKDRSGLTADAARDCRAGQPAPHSWDGPRWWSRV